MSKKSSSDDSNRKIFRFEAFVRQSSVFGFDHLKPSEYPNMSSKQRGLAIYIDSISSWLAPTFSKSQNSDNFLQLSLSLFHMQSKSFFGSTWLSDPIQIVQRNRSDSKISSVKFEEFVYILTRITDPTCVCVIEIIVNYSDKKGVSSSRYGCGWTILDIFNSGKAIRVEGIQQKYSLSNATIFNGSPRDLLTAQDLSVFLSPSSATSSIMSYAILSYKSLLKINSLIAENSLIGKYDVIPGIIGKDVIPYGQSKLKRLPCIGTNEVQGKDYVINLPPDISRVEPTTLTISNVRLELLDRISVEQKLLSSLQSSKRIMAAVLDKNVETNQFFQSLNSSPTATISKRILKLGIHNGRSVINGDWEVINCILDERDEDLLFINGDVRLDGYVDNELVAIVFSLEYEIKIKSNVSSNNSEFRDASLDFVIAIGSAVYIPTDGFETSETIRNPFPATVQLSKLETSTDLGLCQVYASDYLLNATVKEESKSNDSNIQAAIFFNMLIAQEKTTRRSDAEYAQESKEKERDDKIESDSLTTIKESAVNDFLKTVEADDAFSDDHVDDDDVFIDRSMYENYKRDSPIERYPKTVSVEAPSRLLAESLAIRIMDDQTVSRKKMKRGLNILRNQEDIEISSKLPSRATKSRLDRMGFPSAVTAAEKMDGVRLIEGINMKLEQEDPLSVSEIIIQPAGIKFPSELTADLKTVFCTFQFYNFKYTYTENFGLSFQSEGKEAVFVREVAHARYEAPLGNRFIVDNSIDSFFKMKFAEYLASSFFTIDIWNADSLLPIGSASVPMRSMLRQGRALTREIMEIDIISISTMDEINLISGGTTTGPKFGRLQVVISNIGRPPDNAMKSQKNNMEDLKQSIKQNSVGYTTSSHHSRPSTLVRAKTMKEAVASIRAIDENDIENVESDNNEWTVDEINIIAKRFQGDRKGTIKYNGDLLKLLSVPTLSRPLKILHRYLSLHGDNSFAKTLSSFVNGSNTVTFNDLEECISGCFDSLGCQVSKAEIKLVCDHLMNRKSEDTLQEINSRLLHEFQNISWNVAVKKFFRAVEIMTLKGEDLEDLLSTYDLEGSDRITVKSFEDFLSSLSGFYAIDPADKAAIVKHFVQPSSQSRYVNCNDVCKFLKISYIGNAKVLVRNFILRKKNVMITHLRNFTQSNNPSVSMEYSKLLDILIESTDILKSVPRQKVSSSIKAADKEMTGKISLLSYFSYLDMHDVIQDVDDKDPLFQKVLDGLLDRFNDVDTNMRSFDLKGDGFICVEDFLSGLCELNILENTVTDPNSSFFSKRYDDNGLISLYNFYQDVGGRKYSPNSIQLVTKILYEANENGISLRNIFSKEVRPDGNLGSKEILNSLVRESSRINITEDDISIVLTLLAADGSGLIPQQEFIEFFSRRLDNIRSKNKLIFPKVVSQFKDFLKSGVVEKMPLRQLLFDAERNVTRSKVSIDSFKRSLLSLPNLPKLVVDNIDLLVSSFQLGKELISMSDLPDYLIDALEEIVETPSKGNIASNNRIDLPKIHKEDIVDDNYEYSSDLRIRSVEKKLKKFGLRMASKGRSLEELFRLHDTMNDGLIQKTVLLQILTTNSESISNSIPARIRSHDESDVKLNQLHQIRRLKGVNIENIGRDDWNTEHHSKVISSISHHRQKQKSLLLEKVLSHSLVKEISLFPSAGEALFFEYPVTNPFNNDERIVIKGDNSAIDVITNYEEWLYCRNMGSCLGVLGDPPEIDSFDVDSNGLKQISLLPLEKFYIPFRYRSYDINPDADNIFNRSAGPTSIISVNFISGTYGHIILSLKIKIFAQRIIVNRCLRFFEAELSTLRKHLVFLDRSEISIPAAAATSTEKKHNVYCLQPRDNDKNNRILIDFSRYDSEPSNRTVIDLRMKCGKYPDVSSFYLLLYEDAFQFKLKETWMITVSTCQRVDSHGYLGSISRVDLLLKGDSYNRRAKLYASLSLSDDVLFSPRGVFNIVSKSYNKLSASMTLLSIGVRNVLINLVDVDSRELISSWIVRQVVTHGGTEIRKYSICASTEETTKKILFKNPWSFRRKFTLISSNPRILQPREKILDVPANSSSYIRLKFLSMNENQTEEIYLFMADENGNCEECFLFDIVPS